MTPTEKLMVIYLIVSIIINLGVTLWVTRVLRKDINGIWTVLELPRSTRRKLKIKRKK